MAGFGFAALGLEFAELLEGFFKLAGEACAMLAEGGQGAGLLAQRFDDNQRSVGFGMFGCYVVLVRRIRERVNYFLARGSG